MLLIYTPKKTTRKIYIFDLLIYHICGYEYKITSDKKVFNKYDGAKINYSNKPSDNNELFIFANELLESKGVFELNIESVLYKDIPVIFFSDNKESCLPFDPFAASFYFVSRYEEYLPHKKDEHGRFEAKESFAYKNGFLEKPVVNQYASILNRLIKEKYPTLKPSKKNTYQFIPTYDIDIAYDYKGKGFFRTIGGYVRSLIKRDIKSIKERTKVLTGQKKDTFDTYTYLINLHKKYNIKPYYFFLVGDYGLKDKNLSIFNTSYQQLIKKLGDYGINGVHPSYNSNYDINKLKEEIRRLSSVLNRKIKHSRQHYIKLNIPYTYQKLIEVGITKDYSMGYASHIGFRAGICSPFLFYDLDREEISKILITPFAVMDCTLKEYMKLNTNNSFERVKSLIDEVHKVNGLFITLWHNVSLCDFMEWKGWKELYVKIFDYAAGKKT